METLNASLLQASKRGHLSVVQELLDRTISPNNTDSITGCNAVHMAAQFGHSDIVDLLIRSESNNSATLNAYNQDNYNPLQLAAAGGYIHIGKVAERTQLLLTAKDYDGYTALHLAAKFGHLDVVRLITTAGNASAVVDATGPEAYRPLHFASESGYYDIVRHFIETKVSPNQVNSDGATPLQVAIESKDHSKVVTALIEGGASTELLAGGLNKTPLYLAVEKDRIQSVQAILAMGKNE
ncbi:hypothetical protein CI102_7112, partial [Trichoderma harzianum]